MVLQHAAKFVFDNERVVSMDFAQPQGPSLIEENSDQEATNSGKTQSEEHDCARLVQGDDEGHLSSSQLYRKTDG